MDQKFRKAERLCSRKKISEIFTSGHSFIEFPIKVLWKETELPASFPVQLAIAVPKRRIRKAVDRNKIKRQIREAYRKNKHILYEAMGKSGRQIALVVMYMEHKQVDYAEVEHKIILSLQRLKKEYEESN